MITGMVKAWANDSRQTAKPLEALSNHGGRKKVDAERTPNELKKV
jgi:hypothetical protein